MNSKQKTFYIIISLVAAFILWYYVVTEVSPEDSQWIYSIPVQFENEDGIFADRNLVLRSAQNTTINLRFTGKRSELAKLNSGNVTVSVDLSVVEGPGTFSLSYSYDLPDTVNPNAITLSDRSRDTIGVVVDMLSEKTVEVKGEFSGTVQTGYSAEALQLAYDEITIRGPENIVSMVDHAEVTLVRQDLAESVSDLVDVVLVDQDGNPVESDELWMSLTEISVEMTVLRVKEVTLQVELISGGGATEENAICEIEPATITIEGDAEDLETFNVLTIGKIDLGSVSDSFDTEFAITVPNGMQNLTTDVASVHLELKNLTTRTFRVTNLEMTNLPEGLSAKFGTTSLEVKLRGPTADINLVSASDIRAVVDLTSMDNTAGQFKLPVTIYVDGYSSVGAIGTYNVLITISEASESEEIVEVEGTESEYGESSITEDTGETS